MYRIVIDQGNVPTPWQGETRYDRIIYGNLGEAPDRPLMTNYSLFWALEDQVHQWFVSHNVCYRLDYLQEAHEWVVDVDQSDHALLVKLAWGGR